MWSRTLTLAAISLLAVATSTTDPPTVSVKNGSYYGVYQETYDQDLFLGMPYAQPPIGDLRFRIPQSLNTTWSEAKNATEYSPECYGYGSDQWVLGNVISEDCLTINVVRPNGVSEGADLPVGVWIHGGGFYQGGSRDPRYNLSYIVNEAAEAGVRVLVGYCSQGSWCDELGLPRPAVGTALGARNIAAFGGDTNKVTIWGESAGGRGVSYQLIAYGGRDDGLFRGAIMQSGSPVKYIPTAYTNASAWDVYYNNITAAANCSSANDTLDCLRQVPLSGLLSFLGPGCDGDYIQDTDAALLSEGKFVHVPILLGTNNDEGTAFGKIGIDTSEEFFEYLVGMGYSQKEANTLLDLYPDIPEIGILGTLHGRPGNDTSYGFMYKRVSTYAEDSMMHAPRRFMSQIWAKNNVRSYSYLFNVLTAGVSQYIGSTHFTEVAFVFYNLLGNGYNNSVATPPFLNKPESYKQLARLITRMWASFIVNQTPNQSGGTTLKWPEYTPEDPHSIVFDANVMELAYIEPDTFRAEAIAHMINDA